MIKMDSTIFAALLTLFVSFAVVPAIRKGEKCWYSRKLIRVYKNDYILPLKELFELNSKDASNRAIYQDKIEKNIDKSVLELGHSRDNELNHLSAAYSFELIRINSYTLSLLGGIKELGKNYVFNPPTKGPSKQQEILDKEIITESLRLLNDFDKDVTRYYKLKFDKVKFEDKKIQEIMNK